MKAEQESRLHNSTVIMLIKMHNVASLYYQKYGNMVTPEPVEEVKRLFPQLLLGVSTHSLESAKKAEAGGADFITLSPVFATPSKKLFGPPQGLDALKEVVQEVKIPVLALGCIKQSNVISVLRKQTLGNSQN